jgi:hypothetical protein
VREREGERGGEREGKTKGERVCEREGICVCVRVHVSVREKGSEKENAVRRFDESVSICRFTCSSSVCERESERARACV